MPLQILNMRCTNNHYIRLKMLHFGPGEPHVRIAMNGRQDDDNVMSVLEEDKAEKAKVNLILDLQTQDVRQYNEMVITVSNQPEWYAIQYVQLEMVESNNTPDFYSKIKN